MPPVSQSFQVRFANRPPVSGVLINAATLRKKMIPARAGHDKYLTRRPQIRLIAD